MGDKWMRRISMLLAVIMLCSLLGCTDKKENDNTTGTSESSTAETEADNTTDSTSDQNNTEDSGGHTHIYSGTVHQATCVAGGYVEYICQCGDSYIGNETEPGSHSYTTQKVVPTASAPGYNLHTCIYCGLSYKDSYVWNVTDDLTAFFSDAAFIGDSVTLALRNYNLTTGALGNATFLCQGSYSVGHAVNNTMYLSYQGQNMTPQDALAACGAKKVFILLGMNDIALYGIDKSIENWGKMVENIKAKNPDIQIFVQSGTPIYTAGQIYDLTNANMDKYNDKLKAFAAEKGLFYVDVATPMKDSSNGLAEKYCSDKYVHLTAAGCELWVSVLKDFISE